MPTNDARVESIDLVTTRPDALVKALVGRYADERHAARVIAGRDVNVFKPDGSLLLAFRRERVELLSAVCNRAWPALLRAAHHTDRRRTAAGGAERLYSGTVGYLNGRPTVFTKSDPQGWRDIQPLLRAMAHVFRVECPEQYAYLVRAGSRIRPELLIPGTPFTSAAVNRWSPDHNARMAVHPDSGNLMGAFGVMTVLTSGAYSGGLLAFPKYRVAVDVRCRDVLIADNREAHGNTAIVVIDDHFERVSVVAFHHD